MTIESSNHWWQNWPKTHAYVAQKMFFPTSAGEIASAIQAAEAARRPLRAVGGGWSFSDAVLPGTVTTNRPNVYAVEALSAVIPRATTFPPDPSTASTASIIGNATTDDQPGSMVMLNYPKFFPAFIDADWFYLGGGDWTYRSMLYRAADTPDFLHFLAGATWRPIRNPNLLKKECVEESDRAGSLVMFDLTKSTTKPSRDWFYNGNGFWSVGVAGENAPNLGSLYTLAYDQRLKSSDPNKPMNLSPRAAQAGESLSLLLSKQPTVPSTPEPVYLINTRSLVSSLQQHLPGILSDSAKDAITDQPMNKNPRRFLFHVEAGITIAELGRLLSHHSPRLSLQAISGSPGATLAGALATGTHGAEFNWPLVVDRVKAVHLVGPGGLQWWIEGDESIVDPQKLQAAYPDIPLERILTRTTAPGVIAGPDWLNAAIVSMGSMGVLYSVVLEVVPLFGVHEIVVQTTWRDLPSPGAVGQPDWRWCDKCQGLFFANRQSSVGGCPAGGMHQKGTSGNYTIARDVPTALGQADWRWCHKCQGLFFSAGQSSVGRCPAGGMHEKGTSGNYTIAHESPAALGQADWRWCHKCQGLFFSGEQSSVGRCPAGGMHEKGTSGNYTIAHDVTSLLRSPATSREASSFIVKLLQRGDLNGTGIVQANAQGDPINQYADLAINPNRRVDGDYDCWIGNREVTARVPFDAQPSAGNETADMIKGIGMAFGSEDLKNKLQHIYGFGSLLDIVGNAVSYSGAQGKFSKVTQASDIINVAIDTFLTPLVAPPPGPEVAQALLSGMLSGLLGTANCARRSDKTGISVGALGFPESGVMGTALEIAVSPADAFGFLQTEILDQVDLNMNQNKPFFGYVSIRLCSMTKSLMGMQQFGDAANPCSVMIEVVGYGTPESREFIRLLQQRTLNRIHAGSLDAMLHWGLENELLTAQHLRKTKALQKHSLSGMSKLRTFKTVRALVHAAAPASYRVFDNNFTERLGLSALDGIAFCDDNKQLIHIWHPTALFAQPGSPLVENSRSFLKDLGLLNQSKQAVKVNNVRITSVNSADPMGHPVFLATPPPLPFTIGAGQRYGLVVEYSVTKAGPLTGFVEIECDDPIDPIVRIPLSTTVVANRHAELEFSSLSPSLDPLDLGITPVGTPVERSITIRNAGFYDANFKMEMLPDQPSGTFTTLGVLPALAPPNSLAHNQSVEFRVRYDPKSRGAAQAKLGIDVYSSTDISTVQYSHHYDIPLTGTALMPVIFLARGPQRWVHGLPGEPDMPIRDIELKMLDFGIAEPDKTSSASFWIRNVGDAPLTVQGVVAQPRGNFGVTDDGTIFPALLQPGREMEVPCSFLAPAVPGRTLTSTFRVDSGNPLLPDAVLEAKGRVAGPRLTEPIEFEQGIVVVSPPASATLTFRSDGTAPVSVRHIELIELNPGANFSLSGAPLTMPSTLAPGTELTLIVTLTATLPGVYEADLLVRHNGNPRLDSRVRLRGNVP